MTVYRISVGGEGGLVGKSNEIRTVSLIVVLKTCRVPNTQAHALLKHT